MAAFSSVSELFTACRLQMRRRVSSRVSSVVLRGGTCCSKRFNFSPATIRWRSVSAHWFTWWKGGSYTIMDTKYIFISSINSSRWQNICWWQNHQVWNRILLVLKLLTEIQYNTLQYITTWLNAFEDWSPNRENKQILTTGWHTHHVFELLSAHGSSLLDDSS